MVGIHEWDATYDVSHPENARKTEMKTLCTMVLHLLYVFPLLGSVNMCYQKAVLLSNSPQMTVEDMPLNDAVRRANTNLTKLLGRYYCRLL